MKPPWLKILFNIFLMYICLIYIIILIILIIIIISFMNPKIEIVFMYICTRTVIDLRILNIVCFGNKGESLSWLCVEAGSISHSHYANEINKHVIWELFVFNSFRKILWIMMIFMCSFEWKWSKLCESCLYLIIL